MQYSSIEMFNRFLQQKQLLAFIYGLVVIIFLTLLLKILSSVVLNLYISTIPISQLSEFFSSTQATLIYRSFAVADFLIPFIAGFVVGWSVKKRGIVYGLFFGFIFLVLSFAMTFITYALPFLLITKDYTLDESVYTLVQQSITSQMATLPVILLLTSLGGGAGQYGYHWAHLKHHRISHH